MVFHNEKFEIFSWLRIAQTVGLASVVLEDILNLFLNLFSE